MKGYTKINQRHKRTMITNDIMYKHLPYGKWTTINNEEYLFNRDYEPIRGWSLETNKTIPVAPNLWVEDIVKTEMYYGNGIEVPSRSITVMRKLWNILAEWSERSFKAEGLFCSAAAEKEQQPTIKQLAWIVGSHSNYNDRLWNILNDCRDYLPIECAALMEYDYSYFFPFFVLCGASINREFTYEGVIHITIEIPSEKEEEFYKQLEKYLKPFKK